MSYFAVTLLFLGCLLGLFGLASLGEGQEPLLGCGLWGTAVVLFCTGAILLGLARLEAAMRHRR